MNKIAILFITMLLPTFALAQSAEECNKKGEEYYNAEPPDYKNALKWFEKAADQGHAVAQGNLGRMYSLGLGVSKDYAKALKWLRIAAEQNVPLAQNCLGVMYNNGYGVAKDYSEALKWYRKAADQGFARAMVNIGIMYEKGEGVDKSKSKAYKWYQKAADQGYAEGQRNVGRMYENGKGYYYNWNSCYSEALKWYQKAVEQGNSNAMNDMGRMYLNGKGVAQSYREAFEWFMKSADKGNKFAMINIGLLFEEGKGVPQNYQTAKEWYQKALDIDPDYSKAKTCLAKVEIVIGDQTNNNSQANNNNQSNNNNNSSTVNQQPQVNKVVSEIDIDIPQVDLKNGNTFAIIIANEDYQDESKVDFAKNDGEIFKQYCHKTLGLPEKNVHLVTNATLNNIIGELDWLQQVCEAFGGDASVIFYYAGHGIPDEASGSSYLLPIDGNSRILRTCYSINELYKLLGKLPTKKVTVLMDACFSGAKRDGSMLASARGVAIKAKPDQPKGNMIVITAAQGEETAYKYDEMGHGLFTYFLLKKLRDTKGDVTMGELSSYIKEQVKRYSIVENGKSQTPSIMTSGNLNSTWQSLKFY